MQKMPMVHTYMTVNKINQNSDKKLRHIGNVSSKHSKAADRFLLMCFEVHKTVSIK